MHPRLRLDGSKGDRFFLVVSVLTERITAELAARAVFACFMRRVCCDNAQALAAERRHRMLLAVLLRVADLAARCGVVAHGGIVRLVLPVKARGIRLVFNKFRIAAIWLQFVGNALQSIKRYNLNIINANVI